MIRKFTVTVTTATATGEGLTPHFDGYIESIQYIKPGSGGFSDGVDFTCTVNGTGENVWVEENVNASAIRRPRAATHSTAGVAALYASGGTAVLDKIAVSRDRVKIAVAAGGNGTTGTFVVTVNDSE